MNERNIRLELMYDGTAYHGFQRQKNGLTIQECIENAIKSAPTLWAQNTDFLT